MGSFCAASRTESVRGGSIQSASCSATSGLKPRACNVEEATPKQYIKLKLYQCQTQINAGLLLQHDAYHFKDRDCRCGPCAERRILVAQKEPPETAPRDGCTCQHGHWQGPGTQCIMKVGVKRRYYRIWIRDVVWLGPPAPKLRGLKGTLSLLKAGLIEM